MLYSNVDVLIPLYQKEVFSLASKDKTFIYLFLFIFHVNLKRFKNLCDFLSQNIVFAIIFSTVFYLLKFNHSFFSRNIVKQKLVCTDREYALTNYTFEDVLISYA